jgi:hypothetical protein
MGGSTGTTQSPIKKRGLAEGKTPVNQKKGNAAQTV